MAASMKMLHNRLASRWTSASTNIRSYIRILEQIIRNEPPPQAFALAGYPSQLPMNNNKEQSIEADSASAWDGFLFAVQRHRRTIETRLRRKFAFTKYYENAWPKKNLVPCNECGNFKEKGHLCGHCYEKVRAETKEMQAKMGEDLEWNVPRSETVFVYDGETENAAGKYVVKMDKARPSWFPKQLLSKTKV